MKKHKYQYEDASKLHRIPAFRVRQDSKAGSVLIIFQPHNTQNSRNFLTVTLVEEKETACMVKDEFGYRDLSELEAFCCSRNIMFLTHLAESTLLKSFSKPRTNKR